MGQSLISRILKNLLFKKDLKTTQLARELNIPQQTLQRIVSGASPTPHLKTLKPIADFFNITVEQLKGEKPLPDSLSNTSSMPKVRSAKAIPVIPWENIETYLKEPKAYESHNEIFVNQSSSNETTFAIILNDSSMEPYFPKGSYLILDPEKRFKDRSYVLVKIGESLTLIFRQLITDGEFNYLKPLNSDLGTFPMRQLKEMDRVLAVMVEFRYYHEL